MFSLNAGEREKFGDGPVSHPERRYAAYQSLLQKTDKIMRKQAIEWHSIQGLAFLLDASHTTRLGFL